MRRALLQNLLLLGIAIVVAALVLRTPPTIRWLVVCITLGVVFGVARSLRGRR